MINTEQEVKMTLGILRSVVENLTPEQVVAVLKDVESPLNKARLAMNEWAGKSEYGGKEPVEMRRDELLAVIKIVEPIMVYCATH